MPEFVTVAKTNEIPAGYIKLVQLEGHNISLANADGSFYAVDDLCPHEEGSLSEGEIEGESIICPYHGSQFSLKTGAYEAGPASAPIATHQVLVQGDEVKIARPGT